VLFDGGGHLGYPLPITDAEQDVDEYLDDDEDPGPSFVFSPLYTLGMADRCAECGKAVQVHAGGFTSSAVLSTSNWLNWTPTTAKHFTEPI
jgi:hypothetical protein